MFTPIVLVFWIQYYTKHNNKKLFYLFLEKTGMIIDETFILNKKYFFLLSNKLRPKK